MSLFFRNSALADVFSCYGESLSQEEGLSLEQIKKFLENGSMVLLGNPAHPNLRPILVGQPSRIKINANIGTSPMRNNVQDELHKLHVALYSGADTIMDLSIAGDLKSIRNSMISACPIPLGTVPIYSVAQRYIDSGRDPAEIDMEEIFSEIEIQAKQGVDFMTVHCGITERAASWASEDDARALGIVSRGGSILARWMRKNKCENPLLTNFDRILDIALRYNVTLSLGDGLRPGAGIDAGDSAQWDEVIMLGRLTKQARLMGVQCMVEGPGHVPMSEVGAQIRGIKKACNNAPLYVLGPLVVDSCPGYDHIAGAIGAAIAVQEGADFLCYLTPAEHLTLPDCNDVHAGIMASRIAAQAGEISLGRRHALYKEKSMAQARKSLDWKAMQENALDSQIVCSKRAEHANEEACAMCGDFCALKMLQGYE